MRTGPLLTDLTLTFDEVLEAIQSLDTNKSTGPDGISARLFKETAREIAPSLTCLTNHSGWLGIYPDDKKLANIVPVYKKRRKTAQKTIDLYPSYPLSQNYSSVAYLIISDAIYSA
mgnify:CR=1 FL=1